MRLATPFLTLAGLLSAPLFAQAPVDVILDTDFRADCDDAGALGVLHALADLGECSIRAVMCSSLEPWASRGIDAVNTFYGRPNIPIGQYNGSLIPQLSAYAGNLAHVFPNDDPESEDACDLYRRLLSEAPDDSITIVTIGFLTNIDELLRSPADAISPMTGAELVQNKVHELVSLAGGFPSHGTEFNSHYNGLWPVTRFVADEMNALGVPYTFVGIEIADDVRTGDVIRTFENTHPVGYAYESWLTFFEQFTGQPQPDRPAWDHSAVVYAVRGLGTLWNRVDVGYNNITSNGNSWTTSQDSTHSYVKYVNTSQGEAELQATLDALQIAPPANPRLPQTVIAAFEDGNSGVMRSQGGSGPLTIDDGDVVFTSTNLEALVMGHRLGNQTIVSELTMMPSSDHEWLGFTLRAPTRDGGFQAGPRVLFIKTSNNTIATRLFADLGQGYGPITPQIAVPNATAGVPFAIRIDAVGDQITAAVNGVTVLQPQTIPNPPGFNFTLVRTAIYSGSVRMGYLMMRGISEGPAMSLDENGTAWFGTVEPSPLGPPVLFASGAFYDGTFFDGHTWKLLMHNLGPMVQPHGRVLGSHELYGIVGMPWERDKQLLLLHNGLIDGHWIY